MSATSSAPVYTNRRNPNDDRHRLRNHVVTTLDPDDKTIRLGKPAWRQDPAGAVECILVREGDKRLFVTKDEYLRAANGKYSLREFELAATSRPTRLLRRSRGGGWPGHY